MGESLDRPLAIRALQMAIAPRRPQPTLIVRSDRGSQFAAATCRQVLAADQLVPSMSRKGKFSPFPWPPPATPQPVQCYDNAFIESSGSSLKYEAVSHRRFQTRAEARAASFDYIEAFCNRTRLHSSLGYVSPVTFESKSNSTRISPVHESVKSGEARPDPRR